MVMMVIRKPIVMVVVRKPMVSNHSDKITILMTIIEIIIKIKGKKIAFI